jgi:Flp pilus assembly protein TadB
MILVLIFVLVVFSIVLMGLGLFSQRESFLRLRKGLVTEGNHKTPSGFNFKSETLDRAFKPLGFLIKPLHKRLTYLNKLKYQAEILRIDLNIYALVGLKLLSAVVFGIVGSLFLIKISPVYLVISPIAGFFLPDFMMWQKVKQKKEEIVRCFPETVD